MSGRGSDPLRPTQTFVLRLWREPGMEGGDAGWRGSLRPLQSRAAGGEVAFQGLENLPRLLADVLRTPGGTQEGQEERP